MSYSVTQYPYDGVCYITDTIGPDSFQGSGVIIGPHTILTASHVLWSQDQGLGASSVSVTVEYSAGGGTQITGQYVDHYYQVNNANDQLHNYDSQHDFAIIDFAQDLSAYGWFGIQTGFTGGTVHLTGYPANANGLQTDQTGTVSKDPTYSVLNYGSVSSSPGNSGGPVWVDKGTPGNPLPYVVGVVSTTGWAAQLTAQDLQTIQSWQAQDTYLWSPVLGNIAAAAAYVAKSAPESLSPAAVITQYLGTNLVSATVKVVGGNFAGDGDIFSAVTAGTNISVSYDTVHEVLTLSGTDTLADYQHVLESVAFQSTSDNPTRFGLHPTRTIEWLVNDGTNVSQVQTTVLTVTSVGDFLVGTHNHQTLVGTSGNETLDGRIGNETLTGGTGQDAFLFDTRLGHNHVDRITNFQPNYDVIELSHRIFSHLSYLALPSLLSARQFDHGTVAHRPSDHILYDQRHGALYYDPDGTGPARPVELAILTNHAAISAHDFLIV